MELRRHHFRRNLRGDIEYGLNSDLCIRLCCVKGGVKKMKGEKEGERSQFTLHFVLDYDPSR